MIAEQQKVRKQNASRDDGSSVYNTLHVNFSLCFSYVERYVRWGCILNCSIFLLFAVLLSLHLHTFYTSLVSTKLSRLKTQQRKWLEGRRANEFLL